MNEEEIDDLKSGNPKSSDSPKKKRFSQKLKETYIKNEIYKQCGTSEEIEEEMANEGKEGITSLVTITKENLINEYNNTIKSLLKNSFFISIESILIFIKSQLIFKVFQNFSIVVVCIVFSSLSFCLSIFYIINIFQEALRDILRYRVHRYIGLFLTLLVCVMFSFELVNIFMIFFKIADFKKECSLAKQKMKKCGLIWIMNIVIIISGFTFVGILFLYKFVIVHFVECIKILIGIQKDIIDKELEQADAFRKAKIDSSEEEKLQE